MRGSSRGSAKAVQAAFDTALAGDPAWETLAEELFAVTGVVDGSASLRRALADPSREGSDKQGLARSLFGGKIGETTTGLVAEVAGQRWSAERDLADTLESLAVQALLAAAERERRIDRVEDELFRFERIVAGDPGCATPSPAATPTGPARPRWCTGCSRARPPPETVRLVEQAVRAPRGRRLDRVLEAYLHLAPQRRDELLAPSPSPHRSPRSSTPGSQRRSRRTTASRSPSSSSRTPRSWAASGSRSATRSSTAPSCAASTRPAGTSPAADRHPAAPATTAPNFTRTTDHRLRPQRGPVTEEKIRT